MDDDEYVYREDTMTLVGVRGGKRYALGMPVKVTLVKADKEKQELDFVLGEIDSPLSLERKIRKAASSKAHLKAKNKKGKGKRKK